MDSSKVLEIFKEITQIPRESGHEEPMTAYLQEFAKARNLECKTDKIGNVCIIKEATPGKENVPTIVLQGHQDMVCEKNIGCTHDFLTQPIDYVIEDGWMIAKETTLGADDGIGIASMLALLESDLPMGKIECVFTISEETGMDGAFGMEPGFFTGRTLINLDSEDEGQMFIGCAGGLDTFIHFDYTREETKEGWKDVHIVISNGLGGHSGDDIEKGRMNTVKSMVEFLMSELTYGLQLKEISGGGKPNAIARFCEATITVPSPDETIARVRIFGSHMNKEYAATDPNVTFEATQCECELKPIQTSVAERVIKSMYACPHGVEAMCKDIPGLVETSTNLASIKMPEEGSIEIVTSQRSSVPSEKKAIAAKVAKAFLDYDADVKHDFEYPGWTPNIHSHILSVCVESYRKLFGTDPIVKAIHAGLECGLFGERFGDLDMISFGPTMRGVHAPGEKLELASVDKFAKHLSDVIVNFK